MKFNCDRKASRACYYLHWHKWFAWYPVKVGPGDCRWLETVERKYGYQGVIEPNRFFDVYYRNFSCYPTSGN